MESRRYEKLKHFKIQTRQKLGSGTFGQEYKAWNTITNQNIAAKKVWLEPGKTSNENRFSSAINELSILQRLENHPNVCSIYDSIFQDDVCWMIMEYCDLGHLGSYLKENPNLDFESRLKIMQQSTSAVAYMHRQKPPIIHRDIKPENVLLKNEHHVHTVKISDFGVSKVCENGIQDYMKDFFQRKLMKTTCGSHFFLAPELSTDYIQQYDSTIDVFALGLVHKVVLEFSSENKKVIPISGKIDMINFCCVFMHFYSYYSG